MTLKKKEDNRRGKLSILPDRVHNNINETRRLNLDLKRQVDEITKKQYVLSDKDLLSGYFNGDYLPTFRLARHFSKNYKIPMNLFIDWEENESILLYLDKDVGLRLIEGFDHFDKDKNGFISYDELPNLLKWLDIDNLSDDVKDLVDAIDTNEDGKITLCEFLDFGGNLVAKGTHRKRTVEDK